MRRFDSISPIDYRYLPKDVELLRKIRGYRDLDILTKLKRIVPELVVPRLYSLEAELIDIAVENKDKRVPKRVDGKHVGKTTVGEVFRGYAGRLESRIRGIEGIPLDLDTEEAQRNDQISDLVYFSVSALSVEANIANDIRHLFRSEIGEFSHKTFPGERIGSSTMPHKQNPSEYEQIVSLWKAYMPRLTSAVLGQITEHQGDSTNEELPYYAFELECGLCYATKSLKDVLKNLKINV